MKLRLTAVFCLAALMSFPAVAGGTGDDNNNSQPNQGPVTEGCSVKKSYSDKIEYVVFRDLMTGTKAKRNTMEWDVDGTDLGIPAFSHKENNMWFFFGDTFNKPIPHQGRPGRLSNWRGTVVGKVNNLDFDNDFAFDTFVLDKDGLALGLIDGHHSKDADNYEVTKICQGGVEVDGTMYAFYESIRRWGKAGFWDVNYCGAIKSSDGGATWERVYDLTWIEDEKGPFKKTIKELALQDMNLKAGGSDIDLTGRTAPAFSQIYPIEGHDGYIYIYGRHAGRQNGIVVGRVLKKNIEKFDEYEYFTGFKGDQARWMKGAKGLKHILKHEDECRIIEPVVSNMSVVYNAFLGKWLMIYFKTDVGIVYHVGETPYGPFEPYEVMLGMDYPFPGGHEGGNRLYGGFSHELMSKNNGESIYLVISQWTNRYYGAELFEVKFKNPLK